jgi:hypothetical protein
VAREGSRLVTVKKYPWTTRRKGASTALIPLTGAIRLTNNSKLDTNITQNGLNKAAKSAAVTPLYSI